MKSLTIILLCCFALSATAQTKKGTKTPAKSTKTAPKAPVKKAVQANPVTQAPTKVQKAEVSESSYKNALGIKFLYGIAITGKHFFKPQHAGEAILRYNGLGGLGSDFNLTALYEYHGNINALAGLKWYVGGGAYAGNTSFKNNFNAAVDTDNFYAGLAGVIGLDYKIKGIPLAISADWQPIFLLKDSYDHTGFAAENGGIGIKYAF